MKKRFSSLTSNYNKNWEAKTLAVVDRLKFRDSLNWMQNIAGFKLKSIAQFSNHALLLNVQKDGAKYSCYLASITSKTKEIALADGLSTDLMEFKLENVDIRFIPKVIYKYTYTRQELLNLFNLENSNSIELDSKIKQWDQNSILNEWDSLIQLHNVSLIDLDITKETGILNISLFQGKLSNSNWDIEVMKNIIKNEEL